MKKTMSFILALMTALTLICTAALADSVPQPEGGKKFESNWGMMCGLIEIVYEEEGYRVSVDLYNQAENTGTQWEYSCYYNEQKDILESISSRKIGYALNLLTMVKAYGEYEYDGLDDEDKTTVFSLSADGALRWADGHENMGQDLEFRDIGRFGGVWQNEEEAIYAEFYWEWLLDENMYCYTVFMARGEEDFYLMGLYNPQAGKLECYKTAAGIQDAEDFFAAQDAGQPYDAVFTDLGSGRLLYEAGNGIVLEYDALGPVS